MLSRRSLLGLSGSLMAGAMLRPLLAAAPSPKAPAFSMFTKHFVGLPFDQLAETVAELGFKGVEVPVRKGGHVQPARVEEDLPKLVEAFKKCGVAITLMTTDINTVNADDRTEKVLRAAAALGIAVTIDSSAPHGEADSADLYASAAESAAAPTPAEHAAADNDGRGGQLEDLDGHEAQQPDGHGRVGAERRGGGDGGAAGRRLHARHPHGRRRGGLGGGLCPK